MNDDASRALSSLVRFVGWDQLACLAGVVAVLATYAGADRSPLLLVEAAVVGAGGLGLGLARRPLRRDDATGAVTVIALVSWLTMVAPVVITPWVEPILVVGAQVPVVLAAPHVSARRLAALAAGATASTLTTVTVARTVDLGRHAPQVPGWLPDLVLFGFVPVLAALLGLICRHNQLRHAETLAQLRTSRARLLTATDDARRRIARDLHDGAQQHLVALALTADVLAEVLDEGAGEEAGGRHGVEDGSGARALVEELRDGTAAAQAELRTLAAGIYAPALVDHGLVPALRSIVARFPRAHLWVGAEVGRLATAVEAAAYFSCVEALQNAVKHAGPAATVTVTVAVAPQGLRWTVEDDGAGFDPAAGGPGVGLLSMADRLEALGGHLLVRSGPGDGTIVSGVVPLPDEDRRSPTTRRAT